MTTYKILHASRYKFLDRDSGREVSGCKITALSPENLNQENSRGCAPLSFSAPYEVWNSLQSVPGDYDLDLSPVSKGTRVELRLNSLKPVSAK